MPRALSIRSRRAQLEALGNHIFDVLVLGGGISGVTAAHELTRRGYRTA
jgi:glycerol-3-phosphate dehydrogenase